MGFTPIGEQVSIPHEVYVIFKYFLIGNCVGVVEAAVQGHVDCVNYFSDFRLGWSSMVFDHHLAAARKRLQLHVKPPRRLAPFTMQVRARSHTHSHIARSHLSAWLDPNNNEPGVPMSNPSTNVQRHDSKPRSQVPQHCFFITPRAWLNKLR
jgi:hypothetical protein